tara:strand:+ start:85 stop:411 length:327 start_codon:yes stop_codon:yes gene_type:complete
MHPERDLIEAAMRIRLDEDPFLKLKDSPYRLETNLWVYHDRDHSGRAALDSHTELWRNNEDYRGHFVSAEGSMQNRHQKAIELLGNPTPKSTQKQLTLGPIYRKNRSN